MNVAMIAAGGSGARFGADVPKQYVEVLGKPVLAYTLEAFERAPGIDAIEVVCRDEYADLVRQIGARYGISKLRWIAASGPECQDSLRSGIYALREHLSDDDILLMHMSVSPMVTQETIAASLAQCAEKGCSFTMYPILVTMAKRGDGESTDAYVFKQDYVELNTPWTFRYGPLYDLYQEADRRAMGRDVRSYTLDLWIDMGHRAYYTRGDDAGRLKITTPYDMDLFEAYLQIQNRREQRT